MGVRKSNCVPVCQPQQPKNLENKPDHKLRLISDNLCGWNQEAKKAQLKVVIAVVHWVLPGGLYSEA